MEPPLSTWQPTDMETWPNYFAQGSPEMQQANRPHQRAPKKPCRATEWAQNSPMAHRGPDLSQQTKSASVTRRRNAQVASVHIPREQLLFLPALRFQESQVKPATGHSSTSGFQEHCKPIQMKSLYGLRCTSSLLQRFWERAGQLFRADSTCSTCSAFLHSLASARCFHYLGILTRRNSAIAKPLPQ